VTELPLFPLHTVLFPGGALKLRIFEPRYLDLVRRCTREGSCFGVCLVMEGAGAGAPALPAAWGTRARITDFFSTREGMLGIAATGEARFRVTRTRIRDNGLILGEVQAFEESAAEELRPEHCLLGQLLERLHEQVGGRMRADKACYDDAAWVGYRLAELLPFCNEDRQALLQAEDPHRRLQRIAELLSRLQRE
jgi:hypothetical protein